MDIFGSNELLEDVINKDLCIGCGACVSLCPYFKSYRGKTVMLFPCTKEHGRCWAFCPKVEVDLDKLSQDTFGKPYSGEPLGYYRSINTSKAGKNMMKGSFQAGGTVSALMSFALKKNYIDSAILTDSEGILPVPRLVTKPEEVIECSTSKYTASPTLSALNQAIKDGYSKIGIVATPCQVQAIAQMRSNVLNETDFNDPTGLVIGLFCTWALQFEAFSNFISKQIDPNKIIKMDIPPPPSEIMEIYTDNGRLDISLDEIRKQVPNTCSYCIDMTSEFSDISVGVLENNPSMNTIITRTERGEKIVEEAKKEGYLIIEKINDENLEHLKKASSNKRKRALQKIEEQGLLNTSIEEARSYLRLNGEIAERIIS